MPFVLKKTPLAYQRAMSRAFNDYLDDFTIFNNLDTHLSKLWRWFEKCQKYRISLNSKICDFMVFLGMILKFIFSKERKLLDPDKVEAIIKMLIPRNFHDIQVFNDLAQFYQCFVNFFASIMALIIKLMHKSKGFIWICECQDAWETIKQKMWRPQF
jgi:hypothetical protein